jgi:hypothetical protein
MVALPIDNITVNPVPLTEEEYGDLSTRNVCKVKNLDCNNYNHCLNMAVREDWPGFSCRDCHGYSAPDIERKMLDLEGLTIAYIAAGYIWETSDPENPNKIGRAGRIVGVKGGGDRKKRLPVLTERLEVSARSVMLIG